jgi:pimeloyl-ACP methyl ester carboxylesterase
MRNGPLTASKTGRIRRSLLLTLLLLIFIPTNACLLKASKPDLVRIFPPSIAAKQKGKAPLIIIPGILGSELVNGKTGERLWPELFPDERDALRLPIASTRLSENCDDIVAARVIESAQLLSLLPEIGIYGELLHALENYGGYRRGDIDSPAPDGDRDAYYLFAYDWRRDNVESARKLAGKIASIKQRLNRPDLRFDVIAHSMGGLVARYYAMYGDRDLAADPRPDWQGAANIDRLILLGTPNAGSMDAFRSVLNGYSVTEANKPRLRLFRSLDRSMIFTSPSVYQLLPRPHTAKFYDARLKVIPLDLFDSETWRRFSWGAAFHPSLLKDERKSLVKKLGSANGEPEFEKLKSSRENYLRAALRRASQFHCALDAAGDAPGTLQLHLVGGDCEPTLAAALIVEVNGETRTLFYPRHIPRSLNRVAFEKMFLPGDGRVTRQSLFGVALDLESNNPNPSIARSMNQSPVHAVFGCEAHGDLPINPTMLDNVLTLLMGNRF